VYHEDSDVIVLEGRPTMQEGDNLIRCEQVMIFPKKDRVLLKNRVSGRILRK